MNLHELREQRQSKLERQEEMLNLLDAENREFTDVENTEFDTLSREIKDLEKKVNDAQKIEDARIRIAAEKMNRGQGKKSEEQKVTEKFSLFRAIDQISRGVSPDNLEGAEGEMHQEAKREAQRAGRVLDGYGLPAFQLNATRAQTAATAATAGDLIATNLDSTLIPALRPKLVMSNLGATALNGLVGNLDLPAGDAIASAAWEAENGEANNTDPSVRLVELRPNRLAAVTTISRRLMTQSSLDVETWIRGELSNAIARAVDSAAIVGNGDNIDGILGTTGVNEITFGGAVSRAKLVNLMTKIAVENYDAANMAFLMNPVLVGELMKLKTDAGSGLFDMQTAMSTLLGYRVERTTLVPTNIDTNKTAVIFGDFSNVVIANWGGVDIIVNPYSLAKTSQVEIVINSEWDVKLKQPKALAFGDDITWTALS
jgi:HK97 family phage major capsid protein